MDPEEMDQLARLSVVGDSGRGALEYRPSRMMESEEPVPDLDVLARSAGTSWNRKTPGIWIYCTSWEDPPAVPDRK